MVDYSCEECLRYGQTSWCTHCKKMLCSSCRESHKGDLQKSVIDSITGLQQMSSSLNAEWSVVNNKITAIISQCDIFCSTSKKNLREASSFDNLESTGEHVSECGKKLQQIQTIIRQLPSDIPDMDLAGLRQLPSDIPDMDLAGLSQLPSDIPDMDLTGLSQLPSDIPDMDLAGLRQLPSDIPDMDLAGLSITTGETASAPVVSTAVMTQWLGCRTPKHNV